MENFNQRNYYKIYTGTNQKDGHDKVYLGYQAQTTDITFKKDKTTFFHLPFFTETQSLNPIQLTNEGAIAGPIPYMADRIQQNLSNYGNTTPWGNPTNPPTGQWLCSWLYALSGETPMWMDRYYDPGHISYQDALVSDGNITPGTDIKPTDIYYDTPSTLKLNQGVLYQYFHQGEKTASEIVKTFSGNNKDRLRLSLDIWNTSNPSDESTFNNKTIILNYKDSFGIDLKEPEVADRNVLNFKNTDFLDTRVIYNSSYTNLNEFTLNFWAQSDDWNETPGTQFVGNLDVGGFGVFYNNLKYYPYFVVPESFYGHLFYFNQEGFNYNDKLLQPTSTLGGPQISGISTPIQVAINANSETLVLDTGNVNIVYRLNHVGDVLSITNNGEGKAFLIKGNPHLMTIDGNNNCHVVTTIGTYIFDDTLTFVSLASSSQNDKYLDGDQIAFNANGTLVKEPKCIDIKFDSSNQKWVIKEDGNLYYNDNALLSLPGGGTNLAIDPEDNIWVLYGSNNIFKINTKNLQLVEAFTIGNQDVKDAKNINFIYSYNREKNTKKWYALIYHNAEKVLYQVTLNGATERSTTLPFKLNTKQAPPSQQDKNNLTFNCRGDFTGYEWKRIFNKVLYNNNPQIQFKLSAKRPIRNTLTKIYTLSIPVQYFTNDTWHMITCTFSSNTMSIYIDTRFRDSLKIPGNYSLAYTRQNDLYIGTPCGKLVNYNTEINSQALIFDGYLDSIKIYDYAIRPEFLNIFFRERFIGDDMVWSLPTAKLQYVEGIERFFKHKLPGSKSPFFKIKIAGSKITDTNMRSQIESVLKAAIEKTKPTYTELISINWVD